MKIITKCLLVAMVFVVTLLALPLKVKADGGTVVAIDPATLQIQQADIGNTFRINITVTNVTNLWSWKVRINWNSSILNYTRIGEGPFLKTGGASTFFIAAENQTAIQMGYLPEVSSTLMATTSANGSGVLATMTFQSLAAGVSSVTLNETLMFQPGGMTAIAHSATGGQVTIVPELPVSFMILLLVLATSSAAIYSLRKRKLSVALN